MISVFFAALAGAHAQSGSFVIPAIRANSGTDFAYWDLFARPPGSPVNVNYNYANPPALLNGLGEDDEGNPTTAFSARTSLIQTGTPNCFITSSGAIYSFSDTITLEVPYTPPSNTTDEVTNVIFQAQAGGARLNVNSLLLRYTNTQGDTVDVSPVFKALDDPQTGAFSERIISAFQWNLTGLGVRQFKILFAAPGASMALWQSQLDVVVGGTFVQQLGYLLSTRARPLTRFGRPGSVDKNLPITADGRYFLEGEALNLLPQAEIGWLHTGWYYNGAPVTTSTLSLSFPAHDISVTALYAPEDYEAWREAMFDHANAILGTEDDYLDNTISDELVDHDGDGLINAGEYAFGSDPYEEDDARWSPQMLLLDVGGVTYPALRYRTNGAPPSNGDTAFVVQLSTNNRSTWQDNSVSPTTVEVSRALQPDGSELVTERTVQPLSALPVYALRVDWTAAGIDGIALEPAPLEIISSGTFAGGTVGVSYSITVAGTGGTSPYTWSVSGGALPGGLSLNSSTGELSGVPSAHGAFSFTLELTDANAVSTTQAATLDVQPFIISTVSLPGAALGSAYDTTLATSGGTAPFTWSLSSGVLPPGLSVESDGRITGTPTVAGSYSFTVQVSDASTFTTTRLYGLAVLDISTGSALSSGVVGKPCSAALSAVGGTQPYAWSISAGTLPAGLSLEGSAITGTPTTAGIASFTLRLLDDEGFTITKDFSLTIFATPQTPVMNAVVLGATTIGAPFTSTVSASNYPDTFSIVGLPKGLVFNAKTGLISGKPSVTGVFNVQVAAKNKGGTSATVTAPLVVKALPSTLVGSFTGLVARDAINASLGSKLSLTTAANGSFTAKITTGTTLKSATGFLAATAPQVSITVDGKLLSLTLANNTLTGTYGSAAVSGYRQIWNAALNPCEDLAGYYSIALELASSGDVGQAHIPQGYGFATFTLSNAGTFTLAGKTADGQAISSPGFLGPHGELCVYASQYVNKGSLCGVPVLTADAGGLFVDNTAAGTLSWFKQATTAPARTYLATFGPLDLNAYGKYLAPKATGSVVLGLPDIGSADLDFSEAGLSLAAQNPDISFTYSSSNVVSVPASATKTSLTINKASGAISGKFTLTETTPPLVRKDIAFTGQTVRFATGEVKAVGYFLLPQIPTGLQTAKTSSILSGAVAIED